jgi:hypothetical protein
VLKSFPEFSGTQREKNIPKIRIYAGVQGGIGFSGFHKRGDESGSPGEAVQNKFSCSGI